MCGILSQWDCKPQKQGGCRKCWTWYIRRIEGKDILSPGSDGEGDGGTTGAGAIKAVAVSGGMTFADGTAESTVTLRMAQIFRDKLLAAGYDVLMIRDGSDVQLDNVARTVMANNKADCHIALHWDSTKTDKGAFYMSVPNNAAYRAMEPVASHWESHNKLGSALVGGLKQNGVKIFSSGSMEMDLTPDVVFYGSEY